MRESQPLKDVVATLENCLDIGDLVQHLAASQ
jgi:hypothetical protein